MQIDKTVSLPIEANVVLDESDTDVLYCMKVNLTETWKLLLRETTTRTPPEALEIIGRKEKLELLSVTVEQVPVDRGF